MPESPKSPDLLLPRTLPEPTPGDPLGKRLCDLFPYRWQPIIAPLPDDFTQKPGWKTLTDYPLRPRVLWNLWQDPAHLVGVRFGHTTQYALLDIDAGSVYHPARNPEIWRSLHSALESLGIFRCIPLQSSWSGGLHLYIPLPTAVPTFSLAVALRQVLEAAGFAVRAGQLEIFPNIKSYGIAGQFTEYNAHRLPLQRGSGSMLLNDDLQPVSGDLSAFFQQWDLSAAGQDLRTLQQAIAQHRQQYQVIPTHHQSRVDAWQQNLQSEIEEGWTGHGQTNHLLKTIACYGVVFKALSGDALIDYVESTVIECPGYAEWCRHQHEIRRRIQDWSKEVEKYYWPLGTPRKRSGQLHAQNNIVPLNRRRSEDAQARIQRAVAELLNQDALPEGKTARMKAIAREAKCSFSTLQKYEGLWFKPCSVIAVLEPDTADLQDTEEAIAETTEMAAVEQLQTKPPMKGGADSEGSPAPSFSSSVRKGEGAGRGDGSFPQPPVPCPRPAPELVGLDHSVPCPRPAPELADLEVIAQIQALVPRLGLTIEQVQQLIAENFDGKRRSQLTGEELLMLLFLLSQHSPGT